jgi:hypothetical protein
MSVEVDLDCKNCCKLTIDSWWWKDICGVGIVKEFEGD